VNHLVIDATKSSPFVSFDPSTAVLVIKGKSYPENAAQFYAPILQWVRDYLADCGDRPIELNLEMVYLNSSSSKAFLNLFDLLDGYARNGREIVVNWRYHEENDTILECGEEFMEDLEAVSFHLVAIHEE
jgi:hypothetical protein